MENVICAENLSKTFYTKQTYPGIWGALRGVVKNKKIPVHALNSSSFAIKKGECVAYIGPNGAGKSTTIKILTGILHPTSGHVHVLGLTPWQHRKQLGFKIGTVFGQRTQLWYHLPPADTFDLLAKIYELQPKEYQTRLQNLTNTFEINSFMQKPVRHLSLGERMRCEIVASLLHNPEILFLDEPTIGLDIHAKLKIRELLKNLAKEYGTTLLLTSHDTADIEQVCDRVIILHKGSIVMDSATLDLKKSYVKRKKLFITTELERLPLTLEGVQVLSNQDYNYVCEVDLKIASIEKVIHEAMQLSALKDITIENPSMEEIIRSIYTEQQ